MSAPPAQLQKAYLQPETGSKIDCMFNPSRFSFTTANRWESDQVPGRATPVRRFAGGQGGTFDLSLVFDTTASGQAVTTHTNKLLVLMKVDESLPGFDSERNNGRPPWVTFHWGTHLHTYRAIITKLQVTFTYFASDGTPLRANVEMSLEQYEPDDNWARQNPTSGTPRPHRTHQVQVGETLDRIAARYYGDATEWRRIATSNSIADPLDLRPGSVLSIPERGNG